MVLCSLGLPKTLGGPWHAGGCWSPLAGWVGGGQGLIDTGEHCISACDRSWHWRLGVLGVVIAETLSDTCLLSRPHTALISNLLCSVLRSLGSWETLPWALSSLGPNQPTPSLGNYLQVTQMPPTHHLSAPILLPLSSLGTFPAVWSWASDLTSLGLHHLGAHLQVGP